MDGAVMAPIGREEILIFGGFIDENEFAQPESFILQTKTKRIIYNFAETINYQFFSLGNESRIIQAGQIVSLI